MAEGSVRRVAINDVVEQKLIPPLSAPKRPPTQAQIQAARVLAETKAVRKSILLARSSPPAADTTADKKPEPKKLKTEKTPDLPPASPEIPSYYRGKSLDFTRRYY